MTLPESRPGGNITPARGRQARERTYAALFLPLGVAGGLISVVGVSAGLVVGLCGFRNLDFWISAVILFISVPCVIAAKVTILGIPDRRFGKKFEHEYRQRAVLPAAMRGEAVRVRCPRWMTLLAIGGIIQGVLVVGPAIFWHRWLAIDYDLGWTAEMLFWGISMGAYAAWNVLRHEARDREISG